MKNTYLRHALSIISLSIILFSCQKEPGIPEPPQPKWLISKVTIFYYQGEIIEGGSERVFSYNELNKPVRCMGKALFPSSEKWVDTFYYNSQQQLIEIATFQLAANKLRKTSYDKFFYDQSGRLLKQEYTSLSNGTVSLRTTYNFSYGGDSVSISVARRYPVEQGADSYTRIVEKIDINSNIAKQIIYNLDSSGNVNFRRELLFDQYDDHANPKFSFNLGGMDLQEYFRFTYKISANNAGRIVENTNYPTKNEYMYNANGLVENWTNKNIEIFEGDTSVYSMNKYKFEYLKIKE